MHLVKESKDDQNEFEGFTVLSTEITNTLGRFMADVNPLENKMRITDTFIRRLIS